MKYPVKIEVVSWGLDACKLRKVFQACIMY